MKVHAGADAGSGYIHTITGTSANMHDVTETSKLLREDDHVMYGDSGYLGAPERPEIKEEESSAWAYILREHSVNICRFS